MFQPLEVTEARTLWIDSPSTERLGFQDSSRVQIDKDPIGTGDFTESGDGFKAKLLGGMWPDDDELRLLVIGIVPGSPQAADLIDSLVPEEGDDIECVATEGWKILRPLVQIMPAWAGQQERTIFVSSTLPRVKPETVKSAASATPAAVNSELDRLGNQANRKLSFDMWRIQVDAMLVARGQKPTDQWNTDDYPSWSVLTNTHESGKTPMEFVDNYIAYKDGIDGRNTTPSQGPPA